MIKIGKYEFSGETEANIAIDGLGTDTVDGQTFPTHKHTIVRLGHIITSQPTYDVDGVELTAAVRSDKYSIDVLWSFDTESPVDPWLEYSINLTEEGSHKFMGLSYLDHKF